VVKEFFFLLDDCPTTWRFFFKFRFLTEIFFYHFLIEQQVRVTSSLVGGRKLSKNLHSRLALTDSSLSSTEMDHQQQQQASSSTVMMTAVDYYDSINHHSKLNNNKMMENSPVDSLERSLPSHNDYNYRRESYSTTTATASSSNASSPLSSSHHQFK